MTREKIIKNDYKDKSREVNILVKTSKGKIKLEEDKKMQKYFKGNKKLY